VAQGKVTGRVRPSGGHRTLAPLEEDVSARYLEQCKKVEGRVTTLLQCQLPLEQIRQLASIDERVQALK